MKTFAYIAVFVAAYLTVSTMDYNDKVAAAAERQRTPTAVPTPEQARIWSKKCERQGKRVLAKKADGKPWEIHCVDVTLPKV